MKGCVMQSHEMALNEEKTFQTFKWKRKIVKAVYKLTYWPKKSVPISFSFLVYVFVFPQVVFIVWKIFVFKLLARLQTRDINGMSPNPFTWRWQLFFLAEKREQEICRSRLWTCIFRVRWCTVGMHSAIARTVLETNSLGNISLGK